jgi:tetratricopeptide (TPR) repeat protein
MFTPKLRLFLALASFAVGTYRIVVGDYVGLVWLAGAAVLAYGYFKYGTVWLAFREVARGHMEPAAKLLAQVKRPESLVSEERAYFELAWGLVCASRAENGRAEQHLEQALKHALRSDNDRAMAEAVLAQLLVARNQLAAARSILDQALTRSCRPSIAERIKTLHAELAAAGPGPA